MEEFSKLKSGPSREKNPHPGKEIKTIKRDEKGAEFNICPLEPRLVPGRLRKVENGVLPTLRTTQEENENRSLKTPLRLAIWQPR